jgi:hypothetical protein
MKPTCALTAAESAQMSRPRTHAAPPVGRRKPIRVLIVVVFPAAFRPRNPKISPSHV